MSRRGAFGAERGEYSFLKKVVDAREPRREDAPLNGLGEVMRDAIEAGSLLFRVRCR